jgi:hypothetical protein
MRKLVLFTLCLLGSGLLLAGGVGSCYGEKLVWEYRPEGFPLSVPQGWVAIGLGSIAGQWITLDSAAPPSSSDRTVYKYLDRSYTSNAGVAHRLRFLMISALPVLGAAALCLAYPLAAFMRGPWRRYARRRRGCCSMCGYSLTGNVSGICPECGSAVPVSPSGQTE